MEEITVEGFTIRIDRGEKGEFVITIPVLPGVVGQVKRKDEVAGEIRRLIGAHLKELASRKPELGRRKGKSGMNEEGNEGGPGTKMRK